MSTFLLDTHILLWTSFEPHKLSAAARTLLQDEENAFVFSTVSLWEVVLKYSRDYGTFRTDAVELRHALLQAGYRELAFTADHVLAVLKLEPIHKDPFDRALIAQAVVEEIQLISADRTIGRYGQAVRKV